jgi:uncharacterized protein (TIRG00374 family)
MIIEYLGDPIPLGVAYQAFAGGVLYSDFTPARVGDVTRAILIKDRVNIKTGIISVIIDRYIDIIVLIGLGTLGLVLLSSNRSSILPVVAFFFLISIFIVFGIFLIQPSRALSVIKKIPVSFIQEWGIHLNDALLKFRNGKSIIVKGIAITLLAWVTHAIRLFLIALGLGYLLPVPDLYLILPLISALALIPITISGLGLVEGGLMTVLAGYGVPISTALSIAILDRGFTIIFHGLAGGGYAVKKIL